MQYSYSPSTSDIWSTPLTQKEWTAVVQKCLIYLTENNPPTSLNVFKPDRQTLPSDFTSKSPAHFCYPYKGVFLPSGNLDGRVWKPSQGAKPTGHGLMKRYFYCKDSQGGGKVKRQVIWLTSTEEWCFLDYRFNFKGKIIIRDIAFPPGLDFARLLQLADAYHASIRRITLPYHVSPFQNNNNNNNNSISVSNDIKGFLLNSDSSASTSTSTNSVGNYSSLLDQSLPPFVSQNGSSTLRLSDVIDQSTFSSSNQNYSFEPLSSASSNNFSERSANNYSNNAFHDPLNDLLNPLYDLPTSPTSSLLLEYASANGNLTGAYGKEEVSAFSDLDDNRHHDDRVFKKRKLVEALVEPTPAPPISGPSSYILSGFDYLLSHLLSYDQILDTLCQSLCTQLIFNRRFFQMTGIDTKALLDKVQQRCVINIDLCEFPSNLVSNFFQFLFDNVCTNSPTNPEKLPPLYCMACGQHGTHDEAAHARLFAALDQSYVSILKEKVKSLYEWVKETISYLLRFPNCRQPFKLVMAENLHCPFCAAQHGVHNPKMHAEWKKLWKIYPTTNDTLNGTGGTIMPQEPEPVDNLDTYAKSAFNYLMDQMPFNIPSFLYSLTNVRSFLDCLVTLWKLIRLL